MQMGTGRTSEPVESCPSFFKVVRDPSAPHLSLPNAFVRRYMEKIPKNPILKTVTGGHSWRLKFIKMGENYCFAHGWEKLVKDVHLCIRDIVVCWLIDASTFLVLFLGADGCEKDLQFNKSNNGEVVGDGHANGGIVGDCHANGGIVGDGDVVADHLDDGDANGNDHDDGEVVGDGHANDGIVGDDDVVADHLDDGKIVGDGDANGNDHDDGEVVGDAHANDGIVGDDDVVADHLDNGKIVGDGDANGNDYDDGECHGDDEVAPEENICFQKVVSWKTHRYMMTLPKRFVVDAGIEEKKSIIMKDHEGKEWIMKIQVDRNHAAKRYCLSVGWSIFREYHKISDGDVCIFTFNKKEGVLNLAQLHKSKTPIKQETISMEAMNRKRERPPVHGGRDVQIEDMWLPTENPCGGGGGGEVKIEYESGPEMELEKRKRGRPPYKNAGGGCGGSDVRVKIEDESVPQPHVVEMKRKRGRPPLGGGVVLNTELETERLISRNKHVIYF